MLTARFRPLLVAVLVLGCAAPAQAAAPKRIVALTPFSANTLALIKQPPVAVGQVSSGGSAAFHRSLAKVPRLPLTHPGGPNLEQLSKLRTDFVFTADAWSRGTAGMKNLGIRVANREPDSVADVPRQTIRIGRLVGKATVAKRVAAVQRKQIAQVTKGIKKRPTVLLVLGVGSAPYAFLPNSWGGDIVTRAGGRLITGSLKNSNGYARISDEFVVARNPDIIIAVPHGNPKNVAAIAKQLRSRPGWRTTRAARNKRVYISTSNTLLQPIVSVAATIASVRKSYLKN